MNTDQTLHKLAEILEQRKSAKASESYVASLYEAGMDKILDKINEEAIETIDAAKMEDSQHLIHEVADLWFHCLVLLSYKGLSYKEILEELNERFGFSGLVEKAQRNSANK